MVRSPERGPKLFFDITTMHGLYSSGQIIATSHDLTPNGGLVREIPLFISGKPRLVKYYNLARFMEHTRYGRILREHMVFPGTFPRVITTFSRKIQPGESAQLGCEKRWAYTIVISYKCGSKPLKVGFFDTSYPFIFEFHKAIRVNNTSHNLGPSKVFFFSNPG